MMSKIEGIMILKNAEDIEDFNLDTTIDKMVRISSIARQNYGIICMDQNSTSTSDLRNYATKLIALADYFESIGRK